MSESSSDESSDISEQDDNIQMLRNLVKTMLKIYDTYEDSRPNKGSQSQSRNPQKMSALRYGKLVNDTSASFSVHVPYIMSIYEKHDKEILRTLEDQSWLLNREKQIIIWVGDDDPEIKKMRVRLNLTDCLIRASAMKKKVQGELNKVDETDREDLLGSPHYYLYYEFLYYLMVVFRECLPSDDPDRDTLDSIIDEYYYLSALDGIDDLEEQESFPSGHSMGPPPPEKIGEAIGEVFSNKGVNDLMSQTFEKISKAPKKSKNPGNVMGDIFKDIGPVVTQAVGALNQSMAGKGKSSSKPKAK